MYANTQDIIARYSQAEFDLVFDRDGDGEVDQDAAERALADASAEIDGYLVGRYPLPLQDPPPVLVSLAVDIAMYKGSVSTAITEEKRARYEDVVKFLTKVSEGKIMLRADSEGNQMAVADLPQLSAPGRVFTNETLGNF